MESSPTPLLLLVGPTGTGKTDVGIVLCELLNGEIVSADSMQIYRGCDIGTAKVTAAEQQRARHHLIDMREPWERYSAAQWASDANAAIADIIARGKCPIVVGGTGFYIRTLLEPQSLADAPPDPELRARLETEADELGATALHERLRGLDADAAERLHPNDVRRVVRALEVALTPPQDGVPAAAEPAYQPHAFALDMPRERLYARLDARVDVMLECGFMAELQSLIERGVPEDSPVMMGVGYKQMRAALRGEMTTEEAITLWKRDTRRYAKRQITWFRHQLAVKWIPVAENATAAALAATIAQHWRAR